MRAGGIALAHLEEDTHLELAEVGAFEGAIDVVQAVAPEDDVDAERRAVAEDRREQLRRARRLVPAVGAEIVVGLPEVAEPREVVDDEEDIHAGRRVGRLPTSNLVGDFPEDVSQFPRG